MRSFEYLSVSHPARTTISRAIKGEKPSTTDTSALLKGIAAVFTASIISDGSVSIAFSFSCFSGSVYTAPGCIILPPASISERRSESIILPSAPTKTRLVCLPISSVTRLNLTRSPISLVPSNKRVTTRSKPLSSTLINRAPDRYFRISIQNIGGSEGFSKVFWVKLILGADGRMLISNRFAPEAERNNNTSSSFEGWCILSIRALQSPFSISVFN